MITSRKTLAALPFAGYAAVAGTIVGAFSFVGPALGIPLILVGLIASMIGTLSYFEATKHNSPVISKMLDPIEGTALEPIVRDLLHLRRRKSLGQRLMPFSNRATTLPLPSGGRVEIRASTDYGNRIEHISTEIAIGKKEVASFQIPLKMQNHHELAIWIPAHELSEHAGLFKEAHAAVRAFLAGKPLPSAAPAPALESPKAAALQTAPRGPDDLRTLVARVRAHENASPTLKAALERVDAALSDIAALSIDPALKREVAPLADHVLPSLTHVLENYARLIGLKRRDLMAESLEASEKAVLGVAELLDAHLKQVLAPRTAMVMEASAVLQAVSRTVDLAKEPARP